MEAVRNRSLAEHERLARQRFDHWSASRSFQRLRPWLAYVQGRVLDMIDWSTATRVLDIGCGSGWAVYEASRRLPADKGAISCGCDPSLGMLNRRIHDQESGKRTHFAVATARWLPYRTASFDAVLCTAAFHHFPDPGQTLVELRRALRPGGKLLVADTCRDQSFGVWVWDRLHQWFERGHVKYYRRQEMVALLRAAEFDEIQLTELAPSITEARKLVRSTAIFSATAPVSKGRRSTST